MTTILISGQVGRNGAKPMPPSDSSASAFMNGPDGPFKDFFGVEISLYANAIIEKYNDDTIALLSDAFSVGKNSLDHAGLADFGMGNLINRCLKDLEDSVSGEIDPEEAVKRILKDLDEIDMIETISSQMFRQDMPPQISMLRPVLCIVGLGIDPDGIPEEQKKTCNGDCVDYCKSVMISQMIALIMKTIGLLAYAAAGNLSAEECKDPDIELLVMKQAVSDCKLIFKNNNLAI